MAKEKGKNQPSAADGENARKLREAESQKNDWQYDLRKW